MNIWYQKCIEFHKIQDIRFEQTSFLLKEFDEQTAMEAAKVLLQIYLEACYPSDERNKIRMEYVLDVVQSNSDNPYAKQWNIWCRYFVSMGDAEWNQFWQETGDDSERSFSSAQQVEDAQEYGNRTARFLAGIPTKIYNVCFVSSYLFMFVCLLQRGFANGELQRAGVSVWNVVVILFEWIFSGGIMGLGLTIAAGCSMRLVRKLFTLFRDE